MIIECPLTIEGRRTYLLNYLQTKWAPCYGSRAGKTDCMCAEHAMHFVWQQLTGNAHPFGITLKEPVLQFYGLGTMYARTRASISNTRLCFFNDDLFSYGYQGDTRPHAIKRKLLAFVRQLFRDQPAPARTELDERWDELYTFLYRDWQYTSGCLRNKENGAECFCLQGAFAEIYRRHHPCAWWEGNIFVDERRVLWGDALPAYCPVWSWFGLGMRLPKFSVSDGACFTPDAERRLKLIAHAASVQGEMSS